MKTKAAILFETKKPLVFTELELPELKPGQVLVKIIYTGICHSQLNEARGLKGEDKYLPHCLGHEAGGIVEKVSEDVNKVEPGDQVLVSWINGSGRNVPSTQYKDSDGNTINAGAVTTFQEYTVVSENKITKISKEMPLDITTLLGCAIPTGGGIVLNQIKPSPGNSIVIIGVGGIGLSALMLAELMHCNPIIAVDINDEKLEFAKKLGATITINSTKVDFVEKIKELTDGNGVDFAVEAAGFKETIEKAFEVVKWDGGLAVIAGNPPEGQKISINPFDLKGKKITGSWGGLTKPDLDFPKYVDLYLSGKLKLDKLITDRFEFKDLNDVLCLLEKGKILGRAVIKIQDENKYDKKKEESKMEDKTNQTNDTNINTGEQLDIISSLHQSTSRDYIGRMNDDKVNCMKFAKKYDQDYWDGDRKYGYGGYKYMPGRWEPIARKLIEKYNLTNDSKVLDVGCGKAYLLFEIKKILPGCKVIGFDFSQYAIDNAKEEIKENLFVHRAQDTYSFEDNEFDLVISLNTLHNLQLFDLKKALREMERVGKNKYLVVESYRNELELFNLQCWALTAEAFFTPEEWVWSFEEFGYSGDYEFIYFE